MCVWGEGWSRVIIIIESLNWDELYILNQKLIKNRRHFRVHPLCIFWLPTLSMYMCKHISWSAPGTNWDPGALLELSGGSIWQTSLRLYSYKHKHELLSLITVIAFGTQAYICNIGLEDIGSWPKSEAVLSCPSCTGREGPAHITQQFCMITQKVVLSFPSCTSREGSDR